MSLTDSYWNNRKEDLSPKQLGIKNLILKAWRERWADVEWGTNSKSLLGQGQGKLDNGSFLAESLLQQALNGPGPNYLVLSYLRHSLFSEIISSSSLLRCISRYEGYHKPFCVMSLLNLLDSIKEALIIDDSEPKQCLELGLSLGSILHWLSGCMYYSLENLSDLPEICSESEHTKIVKKCTSLASYFLADPHLNGLLTVALLQDSTLTDNVSQMNKEIQKFENGHHREEILGFNSIMSDLLLVGQGSSSSSSKSKMLLDSSSPSTPPPSKLSCTKGLDEKQSFVVNAALQSTLTTIAHSKLSTELEQIFTDLIIVKRLHKIPALDFFYDVIYSIMIGLADSLGKEHELRFIGFTFLQLPTLLIRLVKQNGGGGNNKKDEDDQSTNNAISSSGCTKEDLVAGLELFVTNESVLDLIDSKLHCNTLDILLFSLQKNNLLSDTQKSTILNRKGSTSSPTKSNSTNVAIILKAETTLLSVLKTLDGDYGKNQDSILSVLSDMLGKSFDLILTAASATGRLHQLTTKLVKLNQCSRQVVGEAGKASTARAMIFDISFLMLCNIVQQYGPDILITSSSRPDVSTGTTEGSSNTTTDCFFESWYKDCMVEEAVAKDPNLILARCDQNKVDLLVGQYLQGSEAELKTSLVFWHELCTNSVGAVRDLLLAWENNALDYNEVKKVLDIFRSKMCCVPICISAWLCAYVQVSPDEVGKNGKLILQHLLTPINGSSTTASSATSTSTSTTEQQETSSVQDNLGERHAMMCNIINKMIKCIQSPSTASTNNSGTSTTSAPKSVSSSTITTTRMENLSKISSNLELFNECWSRMSTKGILDVETIASLKTQMKTNGSATFVSTAIEVLMELQNVNELRQWTGMLYGIFQTDLIGCTESLLSVILPSCLHIKTNDPNFVEPQIIALACLTVDCLVSCYYQFKFKTAAQQGQQKKNGGGEENDGNNEPPKEKRRRLSLSSLEAGLKVSELDHKLTKIENMLKTLYQNFTNTLSSGGKVMKPLAMFILNLLQELAFKSPMERLLHLVPDQLLYQLISLSSSEISVKLLLCLLDLSKEDGREKCCKYICTLNLSNRNSNEKLGLD